MMTAPGTAHSAKASAPSGSPDEYPTDCCTTPSGNNSRGKVKHEKALVSSILDAAFVCHVGFIAPQREVGGSRCAEMAVVLPTLYGWDGRALYLHGSTQSRLMAAIREQKVVDVCVTVTVVDGVVLARSAFEHSINFRCAVVYGRAASVIERAEKKQALNILVNHVIRGRAEDCRPPDSRELDWTEVVRVEITNASAKVREQGPTDTPDDVERNAHWAGVLPVRQTYGAPLPSRDLPSSFPTPDYIRYPDDIRRQPNRLHA
jgi:uncharacterized protein